MPQDETKEMVLPRAVSLDPEMRKIVLAGVKFLLARLKQSKKIDAEVEYKDILATPVLMQKYLDLIREGLEIGKDLFVDNTGNPVLDLKTPLVCGATLGELERMLVYTSASKIFVKPKKPKVVKEKKKKGFNFFGKKKEDIEPTEKLDEGADKLAELKPHLIYAWQLPFVDSYNQLQREHFKALGKSILYLDTLEKVNILIDIQPASIVAVKKLTGDRFETILQTNPQAIVGMSHVSSKTKFDFIFKTAKDRVYDFFARDPQYVAEILGAEESFVWVLDESVADTSVESLPILERLKIPFLKVFMDVFREEFEEMAPPLLLEPRFAPKYLKSVVEEFVNMMSGDTFNEDKEDAIAEIISLKWRGQKEDILKWYKALKPLEQQTANDEQNAANKP